MLELRQEEQGARLTIALSGVASLRSTSELKKLLAETVDRDDVVQVVLDMSGVEMLDSAVLGILLANQQKLKRRGGEMLLLAPSDEMNDLLAMTDLEQLIPVVLSTGELPPAVLVAG